MLVDYKEFLSEGYCYPAEYFDSIAGFSEKQEETDALKAIYADHNTEIEEIFEGIDLLIHKLVAGVIDFGEYQLKKLALLVGDTEDKVIAATKDGEVAIRPHITSILTLINVLDVAAVSPISACTTQVVLNGGGFNEVHEPAMEVTWKVRMSMIGVMEQQGRPRIATPGMPMPGMSGR